MGSLTNVVSTLERIIESEFDGDFPKNRPINEIKDYLDRCETPSDVEKWLDEMALVRRDFDSPDFQTVCNVVGSSILEATKKAKLLRLWAHGTASLPAWMPPKRLLYKALGDLLNAFKGFDIVATNTEMQVGRVMETIQTYLKRVFGLAVILGSLAMPGGWFKEWGYEHRHKLESFNFDTKDWYHRSQIADPTLRDVRSPLNSVPSVRLLANPILQVCGDKNPNFSPIPQRMQTYQDDNVYAESF